MRDPWYDGYVILTHEAQRTASFLAEGDGALGRALADAGARLREDGLVDVVPEPDAVGWDLVRRAEAPGFAFRAVTGASRAPATPPDQPAVPAMSQAMRLALAFHDDQRARLIAYIQQVEMDESIIRACEAGR